MKQIRKSIPTKLRNFIFTRDGWSCRYCGKFCGLSNDLEIDHLVPISLGGSDHRLNLVATCHQCNRSKSDYLASKVAIINVREGSREREEKIKSQVNQEMKGLRELEAIMNE